MVLVLDGKKAASELFARLKPRVENLKKKGIQPKLVFFLIGNNLASLTYVTMKQKASEDIGISSEILRYQENVSQEEIINRINELNQDSNVHGMMVQLPIPKHLDVHKILLSIDPDKDADGLNAYNIGQTVISKETENLPPATALGVVRLLDYYNINLEGKDVTVIGRSILTGKPIAHMLTNRSATVTLCHSKTKNLKEKCQQADVIISATGMAKFVKKDWVKDGAVIIDVGYSKIDGKTIGDFDENVAEKCSSFTPVPGGCGPMTIYSIIENTVKTAERLSQND